MALKRFSDEDLSNLLLSIKGVGPWTLGVIRMFYIQDSNVFLKGDLAINKALVNFFNSIEYEGEDYSLIKLIYVFIYGEVSRVRSIILYISNIFIFTFRREEP